MPQVSDGYRQHNVAKINLRVQMPIHSLDILIVRAGKYMQQALSPTSPYMSMARSPYMAVARLCLSHQANRMPAELGSSLILE